MRLDWLIFHEVATVVDLAFRGHNDGRGGLTSGSKLGPYEMQSPLGAGGMGEVYRARDIRLERTVAIKVLPSYLSSNPT